MSYFKPIIEDGKMLVYVRDEFGNEEGWHLSLGEIKTAFDEAAQQSVQRTACTHPKSTIIGTKSYCDTCGEVVA